jgi:hypothetical protein
LPDRGERAADAFEALVLEQIVHQLAGHQRCRRTGRPAPASGRCGWRRRRSRRCSRC